MRFKVPSRFRSVEGKTNKQREIKLLQRKMERSRRANNKSNYHPDMTAKKGRKIVINNDY